MKPNEIIHNAQKELNRANNNLQHAIVAMLEKHSAEFGVNVYAVKVDSSKNPKDDRKYKIEVGFRCEEVRP